MTLFNIISVLVFLLLVGVLIVGYRRVRQEVEDADGLCSVNERGEVGTSAEGDRVNEL